jgi:hypothetical protein
MNGALYPAEVIEGSVVTLKCDKEFRAAEKWQLTCTNGTWGDNSTEGFPKCVPLRKGEFALTVMVNL